ncbi:MAG: DUF7847 domain-containing protein [Armatimonadota bacterium]
MNVQNRRLRPLGITDILDETVDLYKSNFALLVGISAVLYIPYSLLTPFIQQSKSPKATLDPGYVIGIALSFLLLYVVVNPLVTGALTFAISERYLGRPTSIADCYRRVGKPGILFPFIGATTLTGLIAIAAFMVPAILIGTASALMIGFRTAAVIGIGIALILIGIAAVAVPIWVVMRYTLLAPAYIIESHGAIEALRRSWNLMKSNVLKALALVVIAGIVVSMIQAMITAPTSLLMMQGTLRGSDPSWALMAIHTVLTGAVGTVLTPITSIVVILLYYDIRIRKEGFDLELLANELDQRTREMSAGDITSLPQEQINADADSEENI